jgi:RimJ/RimL family protein N-acetyltransferase
VLIVDEQGWPVLEDGMVVLRVLRPDDVAAWKQGEDDEQIRWFEAPGPAPLENIAAAIDAWRASWRTDDSVRHWGIELDGEIVGGVELRRGRTVDATSRTSCSQLLGGAESLHALSGWRLDGRSINSELWPSSP